MKLFKSFSLMAFITASFFGIQTPSSAGEICYTTHVQNIGDTPWVCDGKMAGTTGKSLRMEALWLQTKGLSRYAKVCYKTHLSNIGWTSPNCEDNIRYKSDGTVTYLGSGSRGESRQIEAVQIWLENAPEWGVRYQVHAQNIGWMNTRRDGQSAGTTGENRQLEAIKIQLYRK